MMRTCLKCGRYLPKMIHTCLMHQIYAMWRHKICNVEAQDLCCGDTRSVLWKHKICIVETQDLFCEQTRILILVRSQDKDLMSHTSQELLKRRGFSHKKCYPGPTVCFTTQISVFQLDNQCIFLIREPCRSWLASAMAF